MNPPEIVLLGFNSQVVALDKRGGRILWSTPLGGILGDGFVSLNADDRHVYAYTKGQIYCLDLRSGRIVWNNELKGFGYGVGTICIPGFGTSPDPAVFAKHKADERANASDDTTTIT